MSLLPHHGLQKGCHFCEGVLQDRAIALGFLGSSEGCPNVQLEAFKLGQGLPVHLATVCRGRIRVGHALHMPERGSTSVRVEARVRGTGCFR